MNAACARWIGPALMVGGTLTLVLAVPMVAIKYMTGWAIIPEPFWVPAVKAWLTAAFPTASPADLWTRFGTGYTVALLLVLAGVLALAPLLRGRTRAQQVGYWLLIGGLALVLPGDAVHSWTWHQHGLTIPTPGSNPVANTAYAAHMMGMNFVMAGCLLLGGTSLRRKTLAPWLGWMLALVFPAALLASVALLPTTPSGALWLLSIIIVLCGYVVARGRSGRLVGGHVESP